MNTIMKRTSSIKSLVAGSYERFLFAYEVKPLGSEVPKGAFTVNPVDESMSLFAFDLSVFQEDKTIGFICLQVHELARAFSFPAHKVPSNF